MRQSPAGVRNFSLKNVLPHCPGAYSANQTKTLRFFTASLLGDVRPSVSGTPSYSANYWSVFHTLVDHHHDGEPKNNNKLENIAHNHILVVIK